MNQTNDGAENIVCIMLWVWLLIGIRLVACTLLALAWVYGGCLLGIPASVAWFVAMGATGIEEIAEGEVQ